MDDKNVLFRFTVPNDFNNEEQGTTSYVIKQPTRSMYDQAELFYHKEKAKLVRDNFLTRNEVIKRIGEEDFYKDFSAKQRELNVLDNKGQQRTKDEEKRYNEVFQELLNKREHQDYIESVNADLFEGTAESRAGKQTILWWIFFMSYKEGESKDQPFFKGETFEEKMQTYYNPEELETTIHNATALRRFLHLITRWFYGLASTQEEFQSELDEEIEREKREGVIPSPENEAENTSTEQASTEEESNQEVQENQGHQENQQAEENVEQSTKNAASKKKANKKE